MELGKLEKMQIQSYFRIDRRIEWTKERIEYLRDAFYDQSMTTRTIADGFELSPFSFNMETDTADYLDSLMAKETTIKILKKRKRYLNDYLNSLDFWKKQYLIKRYKFSLPETVNSSDKEFYRAILEINDAINYMFGFPVDIQSRAIDNENLENDFNDIAKILEV